MKRVMVFASMAAVVLYCLLLSVAVLSPLNPFGGGKWLSRGCDYMMRVTEIDCLLDGVNPYDVWHGDIVLKPYIPNYGEQGKAVEGKDGFTEVLILTLILHRSAGLKSALGKFLQTHLALSSASLIRILFTVEVDSQPSRDLGKKCRQYIGFMRRYRIPRMKIRVVSRLVAILF